ncbi:MAG: hypothetical protein V4608_15010 [Bacteroidota bacterium]
MKTMKPTTSLSVIKTTVLTSTLMIMMFAFTGCDKEDSDSVNQDKIYTAYEFDYDKNTDITYARVWFRFGNILGTPLELKSPATITFNGNAMPFKSSLSYYELKIPGNLTATGNFVYTDLSSNIFTNTITMAKAISLPATINTIQRSTNNQLTCVGDSLGASETFKTKVMGPGNADAQYFTTTGVGAQSVTLLSSQLTLVSAGTGSIKLERQYSPALQQKTLAGGSITSCYTALERSVSLQ